MISKRFLGVSSMLILLVVFVSNGETKDKTKELQALYHYFEWEISSICFDKRLSKEVNTTCNKLNKNNEVINSLIAFLDSTHESTRISDGPQLSNCPSNILKKEHKTASTGCEAVFVEEDDDSLYLCRNNKYERFFTTRDKMKPCLRKLIQKDKSWKKWASLAFRVPNALSFFEKLPVNKPFSFYATHCEADKYLIEIAQNCQE